MDAAGQITLYTTLFYVSMAVTILGLGLAVFFFFFFDIRTVRGYLSGSLKRKSIEKMNEQNMGTGGSRVKLPNMSGPMTSGPLTRGSRVTPPAKSTVNKTAPEAVETAVLEQNTPETAVLDQNAPETAVLMQDPYETTALNQNQAEEDPYATTALNQNQVEEDPYATTALNDSREQEEAGTTAILSRPPAGMKPAPETVARKVQTPVNFVVTENTLVIHTEEYI